MNLQNSNFTKKIIAKEFLFFTALISITLISFLFLLVYNQKVIYNIDNQKYIKNEKIKSANNLVSIYNAKIDIQTSHFNTLFRHIEKEKIFYVDDKNRNDLWNRLSYLVIKDSLKYRWHNKWNKSLVDGIKNQGYKSLKNLKNLLLKILLLKKKKVIILKVIKFMMKRSLLTIKLRIYKKRFNNSEIKWIVLKTFILAFIVLFVLRYIKYGIAWSIKTLKQN
jgi:hypothetical protein